MSDYSSSSHHEPTLCGAIEVRLIRDLKPHPRNPRKHSNKQIRQIADSIEAFGFTNPVIIGPNDEILAGHGRVEAAKLLGMSDIATVRLDHLDEHQRRAYVLADNRLAEKSGWDDDLLALELGELIEAQFEIELTGFNTAEVDQLLSPIVLDDEDFATLDLEPVITARRGDLWLLGPHRLLCDDATQSSSYDRVLDGVQAQMIFTDPPYNVPIQGHVSSNKRHDEFAMASGEMSAEQFTQFLNGIFEHLVAHSIDGAIHFVCMDWRHMQELLSAGQPHYELKNLCVWNKDNGGMGSLYRSKHELIFVFKQGSASHINNVALGKYGRYRTNVWNYPGANSLRKGRAKRLEMHPTVKPVALVGDAIKDCSHHDGWILDPFGGSGSTLIAAQTTGRRAALIELDPRYVDVTIRRFERFTNQQAYHVETGLSFADLAAQRERQGVASMEASA